MKIRVQIFRKSSVFDPQGATVTESLKRMGFNGVETTRIGKSIDLVVQSRSVDDAKRQVAEMCDKMLVNPIIESYEMQVVSEN